MNNQDTKDLYDILEKIHLSEYDKFCIDNRERMNGYDAFGVYMKGLLKERGMTPFCWLSFSRVQQGWLIPWKITATLQARQVCLWDF